MKQQLKIASMRSRLAKEVKDFLQSSTMFLPNLQEEDLEPFIEDLIDTPAEEYVQPADPVDFSLDDDLYYEEEPEDNYSGFSDVPESIILWIPSSPLERHFGQVQTCSQFAYINRKGTPKRPGQRCS